MLRVFVILLGLLPVAAAATGSPSESVRLPADDTAHAAPVEWWYWTGHLRDADGHRYGFEVVAFLYSMGGRAMLMMHHALADIDGGTFQFAVEVRPAPASHPKQGFAFAAGRLAAAGSDGRDLLHGELPSHRLDLVLRAQKPPVLQHGGGYLDYPWGGYTYYYSRTRILAQGLLVHEGELKPVSGTAWFDHQWGDLHRVMGLGWDWYALQLTDGRELMLFFVRDPAHEPKLVGGTWVGPDGEAREVDQDRIAVQARSTWTSPRTGAVYPSGWRLEVEGLVLEIEPLLLDQEIASPHQHYWEGAVRVSGDVEGQGYVELVGY